MFWILEHDLTQDGSLPNNPDNAQRHMVTAALPLSTETFAEETHEWPKSC